MNFTKLFTITDTTLPNNISDKGYKVQYDVYLSQDIYEVCIIECSIANAPTMFKSVEFTICALVDEVHGDSVRFRLSSEYRDSNVWRYRMKGIVHSYNLEKSKLGKAMLEYLD